MKRIYVAGPYTTGDVAVNVRNAIAAASRLADAGLAPYLPHLTHFWHLVSPRRYEDWMAIDLAYLPACDALVRLPGESSGADRETDAARRIGLPVFDTVSECIEVMA